MRQNRQDPFERQADRQYSGRQANSHVDFRGNDRHNDRIMGDGTLPSPSGRRVEHQASTDR